MRLGKVRLLLASALVCAGVQQAEAQAQANDPRPFTIPLTYEHTLRSRINGREYRISVALPVSYREGGANDSTRYPVLYLLDGDATLPLLVGMFRLTSHGSFSNLILVGVGYPPAEPLGTLPPGAGKVPYRNIDYTPPAYPPSDSARAALQKEWPQSGGADAFLRVMRDEVIPLVDRAYRTSDDRGILAHSFGGLFAMYALFEAPDLFTRYLITSPSLWWDSESIFLRETAFALRRPQLHKTVYLATGTNEPQWAVSQIWRMISQLCGGFERSNRYPGIEVIASMNVDEPHNSVVHTARALATVYPNATQTGDQLPAPAVRACGKPRTP